jgi:hypothetical protein
MKEGQKYHLSLAVIDSKNERGPAVFGFFVKSKTFLFLVLF